MTPTEQLHAVKDLIGTPEQWTQGAEACDADGNMVAFYSDKAVKFCMVGACYRFAYESQLPNKVARNINRAISTSGYAAIAGYNDYHRRTHDEVMAMMYKAIDLAEQEEQ